MAKNYSESFYLTGVDIADLIKGYHQAYVEKYTKHELGQVDNRFWQNDKGEVIFYAGEQTLIDVNNEGITQQVGRGFYDATLTMTARFLELDTPMLPSENMYVISLINFDRGHWTSAILSLKNIDEKKYEEIYALYQKFKQFLSSTHPEFKLDRGEKSSTNLFVQYATGNRHGSVTGIYNQTDEEMYIREFFTSEGKEDLLIVKGLLEAERYVEGDLKLVLEPKKGPNNIGVFHFDSMLSTASNQRVEQACARFLSANNAQLLSAQNIPRQTGATCGEHSILNAFRYVFFGLTNAISSSDLRKGTNLFCPEIAKLFLFDYQSKTFKDEYARIIAEQTTKEKNKPVVAKPELHEEKTSPGWFFASGVMIGITITTLGANLIAPMLGIASPVMGTLFSVAVGLAVAGIGYIIVDESQEWGIPVDALLKAKEDDTEDKILAELSERTHQLEYPDKNKQSAPIQVLDSELGANKSQTFTPMLAATVTPGETPVSVTPLSNTTVINANATETKKTVLNL